MDLTLIFWALVAGALLVALVFGYIEYQDYLLRTEVKSVPGGLRFTAQDFTAEARRSENTMQVTCKNGLLTTHPLGDGDEQTRAGVLTVALPAAGLRIHVAQITARDGPDAAPVATGFSTIVFTATDEMAFNATGKRGGQHSTLRLNRVPDSVAQAFRHFSGGLEEWIDKLERGLAADIAARREQAAKEAAEQAAAQPLSAEHEAKAKAQLAQWRQSAGFAGTMTDMHVDAKGAVDWLIDLNVDGRIILHADKRHFHGSLKGAGVIILANELEVMVRDEYWQEGDNRMPTFRVLKGASRETLEAWRKRLSEAMEHFQGDPDRKQNAI
jgi:hypothetical protein